MTFRDLRFIRSMFRELGGTPEQIEEAIYQRHLWKQGWYRRLTPSERELVKQHVRSYQRLPGVCEQRQDAQRRYKRVVRRYGPTRGRQLWRERQAAARALNALASVRSVERDREAEVSNDDRSPDRDVAPIGPRGER